MHGRTGRRPARSGTVRETSDERDQMFSRCMLAELEGYAVFPGCVTRARVGLLAGMGPANAEKWSFFCLVGPLDPATTPRQIAWPDPVVYITS
jgi:hypothetical protein